MENLWTKLSTLSTCLFYAEFFGSYARSHVYYKHCFITILRTNYSLGRNSVKFSRLFFTFSTIMNKTIPTTERVFMSLVEPIGFFRTFHFDLSFNLGRSCEVLVDHNWYLKIASAQKLVFN